MQLSGVHQRIRRDAQVLSIKLYLAYTMIGSDDTLSPGRHQAIMWNNAGWNTHVFMISLRESEFSHNENI